MNDHPSLIPDPDARSHYQRLKRIDTMSQDVTSWEAGFLDTTLARTANGTPLTDPQLRVLAKMELRYLGESLDDSRWEA